jgi:hypothetical protein
MTYGPWIVSGVLYNREGTSICETTGLQYVIKVITNTTALLDEMRLLFLLLQGPPRHSVEYPATTYSLYGHTSEAGWYAMKRYDGHVERNTYCRKYWRTIGAHCLQFLQDFHCTNKLIHMDIKRGNILVDYYKKHFVVTDYELADTPSPIHLRPNKDNYKWYYFSYGAEMDQPILSWRFDLVALGYVLASLTVSEEAWTFEDLCEQKRTKESAITEEELTTLRSAALAKADPVILAYMDKLKEVAWDSKEPPSRTFYEELEGLFMDTNK